MPRNNIAGMITRIGREQGLNRAQIRAMIATARQESGLDPGAIGDGGTSFGLFQHHIGGAGGATEASARKYLNPETSIRERAKWFRDYDIRGGEGAAKLQRPADPSGYAASVNSLLGSSAPPKVPVRRSPASRGGMGSLGSGGLDKASFLADYLYKDDPVLNRLFSNLGNDDPTPPNAMPPNQQDTRGPARYRGGRLNNYQDLIKLGQRFGLSLDPGNAQTTGGSHATGSLHYANKAVDFGDARNNPDALRRFASYLRNNRGRLGISEMAYNPLGWGIDAGNYIKGMNWSGHDDHLHVGVR